jgi:methyltransferase (TIGR00027 family)
MDALGLTSRWVAAARAQESTRPDRLFDDPFAAALAGDEGRAFFAEMEAIAGRKSENPYLSIRTRLLDDALLAEAARGTRQIVLLAAGMDARALRLSWPGGTTVFEIERADVLDYKASVLSKLQATPRARRVALPVDLRGDWRSALRTAGHDRTRPSAFLLEGLLSYLPDEAAVHAILSAIASIAAPGSALGLDLVGASLLASPWIKPYLDGLAARGVPWLFGTDDPEGLLQRAGWQDVRVVQPGEVGAWPERWPHPVAPRTTQGYPHIFVVLARR